MEPLPRSSRTASCDVKKWWRNSLRTMATDASRGDSSAGGRRVCHPAAAGRAQEGSAGPAAALASLRGLPGAPGDLRNAGRSVQVVYRHCCHALHVAHFPQTHETETAASLKEEVRGFPGGAAVENLPANAGDTGSGPGLGGSHMPRSSWAREPQLLSLRVWSLCSATREAAIMRGPCTAMKSGPRLPQLEKALAQKRRPNTAINK